LSEKGVLHSPPTKNIQMMCAEPHEEDPSINMVLRSGTVVGRNENEKRYDLPMQEHNTELKEGKTRPREAQWGFVKAFTPERRDQMEARVDPSMITTFLETCMKLLCDHEVIQGLQDLITSFAGSSKL